MSRSYRVSVPPRKPTLVFDGECGFCRFWIARWRTATGERVDYVASQGLEIPQRFPEIPREEFSQSVQFIDTDGAVYPGAEAVLRSLAVNPKWRWGLWAYRNVPGWGWITERCYRFVAGHRPAFSAMTRIITHTEGR